MTGFPADTITLTHNNADIVAKVSRRSRDELLELLSNHTPDEINRGLVRVDLPRVPNRMVLPINDPVCMRSAKRYGTAI